MHTFGHFVTQTPHKYAAVSRDRIEILAVHTEAHLSDHLRVSNQFGLTLSTVEVKHRYGLIGTDHSSIQSRGIKGNL